MQQYYRRVINVIREAQQAANHLWNTGEVCPPEYITKRYMAAKLCPYCQGILEKERLE